MRLSFEGSLLHGTYASTLHPPVSLRTCCCPPFTPLIHKLSVGDTSLGKRLYASEVRQEINVAGTDGPLATLPAARDRIRAIISPVLSRPCTSPAQRG